MLFFSKLIKNAKFSNGLLPHMNSSQTHFKPKLNVGFREGWLTYIFTIFFWLNRKHLTLF